MNAWRPITACICSHASRGFQICGVRSECGDNICTRRWRMLGTFLSIGGRGVHAGQIVVSEQRTLHANAPGDLFFANIYGQCQRAMQCTIRKTRIGKIGHWHCDQPTAVTRHPLPNGPPPIPQPGHKQLGRRRVWMRCESTGGRGGGRGGCLTRASRGRLCQGEGGRRRGRAPPPCGLPAGWGRLPHGGRLRGRKIWGGWKAAG